MRTVRLVKIFFEKKTFWGWGLKLLFHEEIIFGISFISRQLHPNYKYRPRRKSKLQQQQQSCEVVQDVQKSEIPQPTSLLANNCNNYAPAGCSNGEKSSVFSKVLKALKESNFLLTNLIGLNFKMVSLVSKFVKILKK